ncbi:MAG: excinuclease ABC subunit C [Acidobacteriaceae bacterium]
MAAPFSFQHLAEFLPDSSQDLLSTIPSAPGIFALSGQDPAAQPYLSHATDLRRRLRRLLAPADSLTADGQPSPSRRLNLRSRVRFIQWTPTGSEFESHLLLYHAARHAFGPELARRRLRLHPPYMLRITLSGTHPRVYSTNRLTRKALPELFGPFPSRAAAERYGDAVLDLFQLRRCTEDLQPYPDHPGCVYGEMGKCLMPCKQGHPSACTPQQYAQEAQRVFAFFTTRGDSLLSELAAQRDAASQAMDFESAAALHKQWEKVRSVAMLADPLVGPIDQLRLLVLQQALPPQAEIIDQRDSGEANEPQDSHPSTHAAVFLFANGRWAGPQPLSTPDLLSTPDHPSAQEHQAAAGSLIAHPSAEISALGDALALLRRWYYRSEKHRSGEPFLPNPDGSWPIRRIRNAASRLLSAPRC